MFRGFTSARLWLGNPGLKERAMVRNAMRLILMLALAATLSAQTPVQIERLERDGFTALPARGKPEMSSLPDRSDLAIQDGGFCAQYGWAGWERTMDLYLGDGADPYWKEIGAAVDLWNEALMGFNRRPVIRIIDYPLPSNYGLSRRFWRNSEAESRRLLGDGQSVIYFKGGRLPTPRPEDSRAPSTTAVAG